MHKAVVFHLNTGNKAALLFPFKSIQVNFIHIARSNQTNLSHRALQAVEYIKPTVLKVTICTTPTKYKSSKKTLMESKERDLL